MLPVDFPAETSLRAGESGPERKRACQKDAARYTQARVHVCMCACMCREVYLEVTARDEADDIYGRCDEKVCQVGPARFSEAVELPFAKVPREAWQ